MTKNCGLGQSANGLLARDTMVFSAVDQHDTKPTMVATPGNVMKQDQVHLPPSDVNYRNRLSQEEAFFERQTDIHDLPGIFHYWSNRHIRPKLEAIGFKDSMDLFRDSLLRQCARRGVDETRFLSIGSGNCDLEIDLALNLRRSSHSRFVIDCLDLNEAMLQRGRLAAADHGVAGHLNTIQADFNDWRPACEYDGVIAIHVLHHVVNLEGLLTGIKESLRPSGCFAISDMVGRNGHQRWPEALRIIQEFWRRLPPSYRYNHQLKRYEEMFEDWDCSQEGFEGIRSQDILPLLLERFHFQRFVAFGNLTDPFVDRSFGPNFDATADWDRAFIDEVQLRNDEEIARGSIKPTQMFAVLGASANEPTTFQEAPSPAFCVRWPDSRDGRRDTPEEAGQAYEPEAWTHTRSELEIACRRLRELSREGARMKAQISQLTAELEKRTIWGLGLDGELEGLTSRATQLDYDLQERTTWALQLDEQLEERTRWAMQLDEQLQERTTWALQLDKELQDRTTWALELDKQLREERARRGAGTIWRRLLAFFAN